MTNILVSDFIILLLIFLRILAAFIAAPVLGHKAIPVVVKIFLAFVVAYILFSIQDKSTIHVEANLWWLSVTAFKEILTGLLIGFTTNLVFYGFLFAGSIIGFQMGLNMAEVFNPMDESQTNILGEIIYLIAMFLFFIIEGHHYIIRALEASILVIPIGNYSFNQPVFDLLIKFAGSAFIIAIKISAPFLISFFLVQVGEGIVARVIPQMQVFFVTQPLKIGLGLFLFVLVMPVLVYAIKNLLYSIETNLFTLAKVIGT